MKKLMELPDIAKSFQHIKLVIDLEAIPQNSVFAIAIIRGIKENKANEVIQMIKEQAQDNRNLVAEIIGEKLLTQIENI